MNHRLSRGIGLAALLWGVTPACGYLADVSTSVEHVDYAPDGTLAVFTPAGITLYDAEMKQAKKSIRLAENAGTVDVPVAFDLSRDGTRAVVGYSNTVTKDVAVYAIPDGSLTATVDIDMPPSGGGIPVQQVTISPNGDRVYVRGPASGLFRLPDGTRLWGADELDLAFMPAVFAPDGNTVFGGAWSEALQRVQLEAHDASTGELKYRLDTGSVIYAMTVTPDGSTLVILEAFACANDPFQPCSYAHTFRSPADGAILASVAFPAGLTPRSSRASGAALACSSAGELCATGAVNTDDEQLVILFDRTGAVRGSLPVWRSDAVAFSPDGALLAVADGSARVFRVADGTQISTKTFTYGVF